MLKFCLIIIYNHNYERNIPLLEKIYRGRFDGIYHIMPFYQGGAKNVIGVYENSYQFSGYIAQAFSKIPINEYSHFLFVADDMVINPKLSQMNFLDWLGIASVDSFIQDIHVLDEEKVLNWHFGLSIMVYSNTKNNSCEGWRFLPDISKARSLFEKHGLEWQKSLSESFGKVARRMLRAQPANPHELSLYPFVGKIVRHFLLKNSRIHQSKHGESLYPLAYGYSDFLLIPRKNIRDFVHYCGIFAAMRIFVEAAIPTSMIFASSSIKTLENVGKRAENGIENYENRELLEAKYSLSYQALLEDFPDDMLFVHPVKLSKWKFQG